MALLLLAITLLPFSELPQVTDTAKQGALIVWERGKAGRIQDPSLLRVITQEYLHQVFPDFEFRCPR